MRQHRNQWAGIAALTLAYWLLEFGFEPTAIENRPNLDDEVDLVDHGTEVGIVQAGSMRIGGGS